MPAGPPPAPPGPPTDNEILAGEELQVMRWRTDRLADLGLDPDTADLIANSDVDWHQCERMLADGCSIPMLLLIVT